MWHHYSWRCCNTNTPLTNIWNVKIKFIHRIQRQVGIYTKLSKCRLLFTFWIFVGVYIHILNICTYKVFCVVTPPRVVCQTVYEFIRQFSTTKLQYCPLEFQPWILNDKTDHCIICKVLISFLISILSHNYVRLACIHQSMILVNQQELWWKEGSTARLNLQNSCKSPCMCIVTVLCKAYQPISGHHTNTAKFVFILSQGVTDHVITF